MRRWCLAGSSRDQMAENRAFLEPLPEGAELLASAGVRRAAASARVRRGRDLGRADRSKRWSRCSVLMPAEGRLQLARHASLLAFCVTTYALAPVAGFGWLLATMGLAQCRPDQRWLRGAYVAVFVLILLYTEIPWTGVLADLTIG